MHRAARRPGQLFLFARCFAAKLKPDLFHAGDKVAARLVHLVAFAEEDRDVAIERRIFEGQREEPLLGDFHSNGMRR